MSKLPLKIQLVIFFLLVGIIPVIVVSTKLMNISQKRLIIETKNKFTAVRDLKKLAIEEYFNNLNKDIKVISSNSETLKLVNDLITLHKEQEVKAIDNSPINIPEYQLIYKKHEDYFNKLVKIKGYDDLFIICAKHGHIMFTSAKKSDFGENLSVGKLKNSALAKLWKKVKETQKTTIIDLKPYAPSNNEPVIFIGNPIYDKNGKFVSVYAVEISTKKIDEIMNTRIGFENIVNGKNISTGETYLIGSDGLMRSDSFLDPNHTVKASFINPSKAKVDTKATEDVFNNKTDLKLIKNHSNNWVYSAYSPLKIKGLKWAIIAEINKAEVDITINNMKTQRNYILLILALILVLFSLFISKKLTDPIIKPIRNMNNLISSNKGDLTIKIDTNQKANIEINTLAKNINDFISDTQKIIKTITHQSTILESSSKELQATSSHILSNTKETDQKTDELNSRADNILNQTETVASAVEQSSANLSEVANLTKNIKENTNEINNNANTLLDKVISVSSAIEEMNATISEISKNTANAANISNEASSQSIATVERISKLKNMANTIGEVVDIIKDIAAQTNLLALNATIEAASAGDAGKGFAVVANEIKNLARQTGEATQKITEQILGIQDSVENSSNDINNVLNIINNLNEINTSIASTLEEQSATINEVSISMAETSSVTEKTVKSINKVSNNIDEVSNNIDQVSEGISLVSENSAKTSIGMKQISSFINLIKDNADESVSGAQQVNSSSEELSKLSISLNDIIKKFKI